MESTKEDFVALLKMEGFRTDEDGTDRCPTCHGRFLGLANQAERAIIKKYVRATCEVVRERGVHSMRIIFNGADALWFAQCGNCHTQITLQMGPADVEAATREMLRRRREAEQRSER